MLKHLSAALVGVSLTASLASAQDSAGTSPTFSLELNKAETVDGNCSLSYLATNSTGTELSAIGYEVVVFDGAGVVGERLILNFGRLQDERRKLVSFIIERSCDDISFLLVNDVAECTAEDGSALDCLDALAPSSRAPIEFGF